MQGFALKRLSLLLLDRDNVIVEMPSGKRYPYGDDPIVLVPGAAELISSANRAGVPVCIVTNQSGIARASYPEMTQATVAHFHDQLRELLKAESASIVAIYACPHDESDCCSCRKPKPGLVLRALMDFGVPKQDALFVGDQPTDLEAARRAGVAGVMVGAANESSPRGRDQVAFSTLPEVRQFLVRCWGLQCSAQG